MRAPTSGSEISPQAAATPPQDADAIFNKPIAPSFTTKQPHVTVARPNAALNGVKKYSPQVR